MRNSLDTTVARATVLAAILLGAESRAQHQSVSTTGACSPAMVDNFGSININCGLNAEAILPHLKELQTNSSNDKILSSIKEMRKLLERLGAASAAPRAQLARLGIGWSREAFGEALEMGHLSVLQLFLSGRDKMDIYGRYKNSYAIVHFVSQGGHLDNFEQIFQLLLDNGLDVDHEFRLEWSPHSTLAEHAVEAGNVKAFQIIWDKSNEKDAIRAMVEERLGNAQQVQRNAHRPRSRSRTADPGGLLRMLLIMEPHHVFSMRGYELRYESGESGKAMPGAGVYDGSDGWFLLLDTNSLVRSVTYEIGGESHTVEYTTRLPVDRGALDKPVIPVRISMTDAVGRALGPLTIELDREDLP